MDSVDLALSYLIKMDGIIQATFIAKKCEPFKIVWQKVRDIINTSSFDFRLTLSTTQITISKSTRTATFSLNEQRFVLIFNEKILHCLPNSLYVVLRESTKTHLIV